MVDWRSGGYFQALRAAIVNPADINFFTDQPSAQPWLNNTRYTATISPARNPQTEGEDELFGKALQTDDTIQHWLSLISNTAFPILAPRPPSETPLLSGKFDAPDVVSLLYLQHGINGFRGTAHGGLLCAVLDEAMGFTVELHRHASSSSREELYTAKVNIDYRRPVLTPDMVVVKTWLEKRDGRKWYLRGLVENSKGERCVDVEGLWVAARPRKL
ncbi:hypothetical protein M409DRAFT_70309 [Zasmidium cellare ATCC 36951]|uniref:Thioesterase domain-containing protein n=1 Tax=Zasmidium cellare ATCC 36951 TaxID=1080233 RepID=A0A6A6C0L3_ZASCE|nr:uncharacterized protein M409DRAFT_70309 [Zasmidium cellare ATCC 36951]KAF2160551.1 hypothetical protein M409DRAFT_70309 [Zasmidium cellare ATCC 36951]